MRQAQLVIYGATRNTSAARNALALNRLGKFWCKLLAPIPTSFTALGKMLVCCRRVMFLVKAGSPVDATIESLRPLLEKGDIMIDGGNEW